MTRLVRLTRAELTDEQSVLFDAIAGGEVAGKRPRHPRLGVDGALEGPFNARLLNPAIGTALSQLGTAVRYQSTLTERVRELVILAVAYIHDCAYERYAHEDIGRAIGLSDAEIATVCQGRTPPSVSADEKVVLDAAWALLRTGDLHDSAYDLARAVLGDQGLFELTTIIGLYALTAIQLRVFRVIPPHDALTDRELSDSI